MTMVTQTAIENGYRKMKQLPQNKLILILNMIDQLSDPELSVPTVTLGIADGKYHIPEDINQYDDVIAEFFGAVI